MAFELGKVKQALEDLRPRELDKLEKRGLSAFLSGPIGLQVVRNVLGLAQQRAELIATIDFARDDAAVKAALLQGEMRGLVKVVEALAEMTEETDDE